MMKRGGIQDGVRLCYFFRGTLLFIGFFFNIILCALSTNLNQNICKLHVAINVKHALYSHAYVHVSYLGYLDNWLFTQQCNIYMSNHVTWYISLIDYLRKDSIYVCIWLVCYVRKTNNLHVYITLHQIFGQFPI